MRAEKLNKPSQNKLEESSEKSDYLGTLLPILTYPHPTLSKVALPVEVFNSELKKFCKDLIFTMYESNGIGLAAPQVGVSQRIFVVDIKWKEKKDHSEEETFFQPMIFINPVIKDCEGQTIFREGCLSLPSIYDDVIRYRSCTVDYQDVEGAHHSIKADDLLSICVQHENDHLDGIVFIERIDPKKKDRHVNKMVEKRQAAVSQ